MHFNQEVSWMIWIHMQEFWSDISFSSLTMLNSRIFRVFDGRNSPSGNETRILIAQIVEFQKSFKMILTRTWELKIENIFFSIAKFFIWTKRCARIFYIFWYQYRYRKCQAKYGFECKTDQKLKITGFENAWL